MQTTIDVLIVDDCDADAELTLLAIRRADDTVRTLRFKDGQQALQFMHATGLFSGWAAGLPRLILLDVVLPILNGLKVLEGLRAQQQTRDIPIVMLSSTANPLALKQSTALGASDYIVKPGSFEKYCAEVERLIERWLVDRPAGQLMTAPVAVRQESA